MRKVVYLCLLFTSILPLQFIHSNEIKFESLTWFDYEAIFDDSMNVTEGGNFYIGRAYLTLKSSYLDKLYMRVTLDMSKSDDTFDHYFKYAYMDYEIIKAFKITVGLQKVMFGYMAKWDYQLPKRYYSVNKVSSSTDLGLGVSGILFNGIFAYNLQILNGEGYKFWKPMNNTCFKGIGNILVEYSDWGNIGIAFQYSDYNSNFDYGFTIYNYNDFKVIYTVIDYFGLIDDSNLSSYLSATVGIKPFNRLSIISRIDMEIGNDIALYLGANILPITNINIKPMIGVTFGDIVSYELKTELDFYFDIQIVDDKPIEFTL